MTLLMRLGVSMAIAMFAAIVAQAEEAVPPAGGDRNVIMKHISTVRRCQGWGGEIVEFEFHYPQLRGKPAAVAAANRTIRDAVSIDDELEGCAQRARIPRQPIAGASIACEISGRHGALLTIRCTRGACTADGRTSGSDSYLNLDMTTGEPVTLDALIANEEEFTAIVGKELIEQNGDLHTDTEDGHSFVEEVTRRLVRSCGISGDTLSCTALMGTHLSYDVAIPLTKLQPVLSPRYFP